MFHKLVSSENHSFDGFTMCFDIAASLILQYSYGQEEKQLRSIRELKKKLLIEEHESVTNNF